MNEVVLPPERYPDLQKLAAYIASDEQSRAVLKREKLDPCAYPDVYEKKSMTTVRSTLFPTLYARTRRTHCLFLAALCVLTACKAHRAMAADFLKPTPQELSMTSLPDVEVGSIVEYRYYTRINDNIFESPIWMVQDNLYVKKAHFAWYPTTKELVDEDTKPINSISWFPVLPPGNKIEVHELPAGGVTSLPAREYELHIKDVPPRVKEEYMPPIGWSRKRTGGAKCGGRLAGAGVKTSAGGRRLWPEPVPDWRNFRAGPVIHPYVASDLNDFDEPLENAGSAHTRAAGQHTLTHGKATGSAVLEETDEPASDDAVLEANEADESEERTEDGAAVDALNADPQPDPEPAVPSLSAADIVGPQGSPATVQVPFFAHPNRTRLNLYLLRHGSAGTRRANPKIDVKRPLDKEGKRHCLQLAHVLNGFNLSFDLIVSSPLKRCLQTAQLIGTETGYEAKILHAEGLEPDASFPEFQRLVHECRTYENVLMVGHNPTMTYFLGELIGGREQQGGSQPARVRLRKGSIARVTLDRGPAMLQWLLDPRIVRALYDTSTKSSRRKTSRK